MIVSATPARLADGTWGAWITTDTTDTPKAGDYLQLTNRARTKTWPGRVTHLIWHAGYLTLVRLEPRA